MRILALFSLLFIVFCSFGQNEIIVNQHDSRIGTKSLRSPVSDKYGYTMGFPISRGDKQVFVIGPNSSTNFYTGAETMGSMSSGHASDRDAEGNIWFGNDKYLYKVVKGQIIEQKEPDYLRNDTITSIYRVGNGIIISYTKYLVYLENNKFEIIDSLPNLKTGWKNSHINIFELDDGQISVGVINDEKITITKYNLKSKSKRLIYSEKKVCNTQIIHFSKGIALNNFCSDRPMTTTILDLEGKILFNSGERTKFVGEDLNGFIFTRPPENSDLHSLSKYKIEHNRIDHIFNYPTYFKGSAGSSIIPMNNAILFTTNQNGYIASSSTIKETSEVYNRLNLKGNFNIYNSRDGNYWVCLWGGNLMYEIKVLKELSFKYFRDASNGISIFSSQNGSLLLTPNSDPNSGLWQYNDSTDQIVKKGGEGWSLSISGWKKSGNHILVSAWRIVKNEFIQALLKLDQNGNNIEVIKNGDVKFSKGVDEKVYMLLNDSMFTFSDGIPKYLYSFDLKNTHATVNDLITNHGKTFLVLTDSLSYHINKKTGSIVNTFPKLIAHELFGLNCEIPLKDEKSGKWFWFKNDQLIEDSFTKNGNSEIVGCLNSIPLYSNDFDSEQKNFSNVFFYVNEEKIEMHSPSPLYEEIKGVLNPNDRSVWVFNETKLYYYDSQINQMIFTHDIGFRLGYTWDLAIYNDHLYVTGFGRVVNKISIKDFIPQSSLVTFSSIEVNGKTISDFEQIQIHSDQKIKFEFYSEDSRFNKVTYQFRLKGYSSNWSDWISSDQTSFNNLTPGNYVFEVRVKNHNGLIGEINSIKFEVLPYWYETKSFFIGIGVLGILFVFGLIRLNSVRLKLKNKNLERIVNEKTIEVREQHHQLEEIHAEIQDSIAYAKRIQSAILPNRKAINLAFPKNFILYQPKDIVAGDFYWFEKTDTHYHFAVADCTGHGVPGAMVSVVCNSGLNRAVREYGLNDPGKILDKTRDLVIKEFEKSEEEVQDGMDIALISLSISDQNVGLHTQTTRSLSYAGAYNSLWIIRKKSDQWNLDSENENIVENENFVLLEIKADKQPIAKYQSPTNFTSNTVEILPDDQIFLYSDGYADQFGGEKGKLGGKKFKSKNLKKFLLEIAEESVEKQEELLIENLNNWKGDLEQIDDICIAGIKF
ncbi:MAG: SpoIIE family protein phosphatase [Crocinitomicaceae bacterium]|nr:SpoIIE family protein phosphatase [Crocinitomicaceae bacterium]